MEVLGVAAALLGAGAIAKFRAQTTSDDDGKSTPMVTMPPTPLGHTLPNYPEPEGARPVPKFIPNRNKDATVRFTDEPLESRMRYTDYVKPKSQRSDVGRMFPMELGSTPNVHVKSVNIRGREQQTFAPGREMRNVLPFDQQQVGPGVMTDPSNAAGTQGFHYGSTRPRMTDVHVHHQLPGSIIPGKAPVPKQESTPHVRKMKPDTFFEVSPEYQTAAPGRAAITAHTSRVEPEVRYTNRGTSAFSTTAQPGAVSAGFTAGSRTAYNNYTDSSLRGQRVPDVGAPHQSSAGYGYVIEQNNTTVNDTQRSLATQSTADLLPMSNPGQPMFQPSTQAAKPTLRAADAQTDVINLAPQTPYGMPMPRNDQMRPTDRESYTMAEHSGPATSYFKNSADEQKVQALEAGRLGQSTLKEMTTTSSQYFGSAKTAVNNATSYEDILRNEGYSQKAGTEITDRVAGRARTNIPHGVQTTADATSLPPPMPNAYRENNLERSEGTNLYVRNDNLDTNPNKIRPMNERLDTAILTDNSLYPPIDGKAGEETKDVSRNGILTPESAGLRPLG